MPGLTGEQLYASINSEKPEFQNRFLFVTGDVLGISTREFLRQHRVPHIGKPFRLEEFAEKLALVLGPNTVALPLAELNAVSHKNLLSQG